MTFLGVVEFLTGWTLISIGAGLLIGPVIRWGLHDEPVGELHPLPSGSMSDRVSQ